MTAIPLERWQEAQKGEAEFWSSADRTALCKYLDGLYVNQLQITPEAIQGKTVLDLGGGPYPLAILLGLPIASVTVVDPLPFANVLLDPLVKRITAPAETYSGPRCDEVWGYNVLQHVIDPAAVIATALRHALTRVRWFDWVDSPIASHHPHSLKAEWLIEQFAGWKLTVCSKGSVRVPKVQHYCAVVAERMAVTA